MRSCIHHIALGCEDLEKLASFYTELFNIKEIKRHTKQDGQLRSIWLDLDGIILMLEKRQHHRAKHKTVDDGLFLLAFRAERVDFPELKQKLKQLDTIIDRETDFTFYFTDPEQNRLAFSCYPIVKRACV